MTHDVGPEPSDDVRWGDRVLVRVGEVQLQLPAALVRDTAAYDEPAAVFVGSGLTVVVDVGPFADPLDAHAGKPAFHEAPVQVSGARGRRISFRAPDTGTATDALHVAGTVPFTVAVVAAPSVPAGIADEVLASVHLA